MSCDRRVVTVCAGTPDAGLADPGRPEPTSEGHRIMVNIAQRLRSIAFDQMAETLARQEQLRRDVVADVAHELRTPVAVLN